jgi:signal transduction histidine kinase
VPDARSTVRRRRKAEQAIQDLRETAIRHRDALLEITRLVQTSHEVDALPRITEQVSRTLGVPRVSVWRLADDRPELQCTDLFNGTTHESGRRISGPEYSAYFAALNECRIIAASDAWTDPRTRELAPGYLIPGDIRAMLDVPLRFHGRAAGVLCIEHRGGQRTWDAEEQNFAAAAADQLTLLREANERLRAEQALREAHSELEIRVMLRTTQLAEARDRAEAADRLKSAFLATMSHELRTPLNSILGFTGILLQGLVGPLNPEQQKQLGMVQNSARHLLSLINDVLDISKIEAGQVELSLTQVPVPEIVSRVVELLKPFATRKNLSLTSSIDPSVGQVTSDARRLEQILINLLNNGIKFTEHGGVRIHARQTPEHLVLEVADTGIGIPGDQLDRLFRPFQQLDTGLARHHEGTGLGLAICSGLARLLHGTIQVQSQPGTGSTFTLLLPPHGPPAK